MAPDKIEELLNKIDDIVGPPDRETDEQREERRKMIVRDAEARRIRKSVTRST